MYEALNVRDIDSILLPPSSTEIIPKDPAQENIDTFAGTILKAFEGQDHQAHIMAHMVFGATPMVSQIPKIAMDLQKHVMEHVQIQAMEQATQAFQQQSGRPPQMGDEMVFEALKSQFIAQGMQELKAINAQVTGADQPPVDPVVQLKEKELQIKSQKNQADTAIDQAELQLDAQKEARKAQEFDIRQQNQSQQSQAKIQAAFDREMLRQQKKG